MTLTLGTFWHALYRMHHSAMGFFFFFHRVPPSRDVSSGCLKTFCSFNAILQRLFIAEWPATAVIVVESGAILHDNVTRKYSGLVQLGLWNLLEKMPRPVILKRNIRLSRLDHLDKLRNNVELVFPTMQLEID